MEIKIDTEKDSHEHIRKAISFLKTIVGDHVEVTNSPEIAENNDLFGMFNDPETQNNETAPDQSSMFNIFNDENSDNEPIESFSINEELTKQDFNEESEDDDTDNVTIIPY